MPMFQSKKKSYAQLREAILLGRRDANNYGKRFGGMNLYQFVFGGNRTHMVEPYLKSYQDTLDKRLSTLSPAQQSALHARARVEKYGPECEHCADCRC